MDRKEAEKMSETFDSLESDLVKAMKSRDTVRVSTLRMLISDVRYVMIDTKGEMSSNQVLDVLRKAAKQRRESIEAYRKAGRAELEKKEEEELEIIQEYLPKMMSEEEVRGEIVAIMNEGDFTSLGQAMGAVMAKMKGKAEGGLIARMVKEQLDKK